MFPRHTKSILITKSPLPPFYYNKVKKAIPRFTEEKKYAIIKREVII